MNMAPSFNPPQTTAGLASLADIFPIFVFLPFSLLQSLVSGYIALWKKFISLLQCFKTLSVNTERNVKVEHIHDTYLAFFRYQNLYKSITYFLLNSI